MEGSGSDTLQPTVNSVSEGCCETSDVKEAREAREEEDMKLIEECGRVWQAGRSQRAKEKGRVFEVYW